MLARINTSEAIISCSPPRNPVAPCPVQGNAGDRIQISRGTLAMRLNVMELGRFMTGIRRSTRVCDVMPDTHILPRHSEDAPTSLTNGNIQLTLKHVRYRTLSKKVRFG